MGGRAALWGALIAATTAGCGGGTGEGTGGAGTTSTGTSTGTGGAVGIACKDEPTDHVALSGTWAAYGELAVTLEGAPGGAITICPTDQIGAASLLVMLTVEQNAADPTKLDKVQATLCSIELPTVTALVGACDPSSEALVSTQIIAPKTFIDALPKVATTPATGSLSGPMAGSTIHGGPLVVTVGSNKGGASMPRWDTASNPCNAASIGNTTVCEASCVDDCAALRDDDGDGFPGVTVNVCGLTPDDAKLHVPCNAASPNTPGTTLQGRAFIDIEVDPTLDGVVKNSCEVTGTIGTSVRYNVVGSDVWLAGAPITVSQAIKSLPAFQVDANASKFRMVRVDGQYGAPDFQIDPSNPSAACATLNMRVNEL
jgi:hypothetical protein